jgi:hypothetical protein
MYRHTLNAVNDQDWYGNNAPERAAEQAGINEQDRDGNTSLHRAVERSNLDEVCHLLEIEGINIELHNRNGRTPLHIAVTVKAENAQTICRLLINERANVRACDNNGSDPLHVAASDGCGWGVRLLLHKGVDVTDVDDDNNTSLSLAVKRYMSNIVAQEEHNKSRHTNSMYFDTDPSVVRELMDGMIRAHKQHPRYWIDYALSDPIFMFFSNDIPNCIRDAIRRDELDGYYIKDNEIRKSQYRIDYRNLL